MFSNPIEISMIRGEGVGDYYREGNIRRNMDQQHETPNDLENISVELTQTDILKEVILDNPITEILPINSQVYNNDYDDDAQGDVNLTDINQVNANVFVHEGGEMISLALNSNFWHPA